MFPDDADVHRGARRDVRPVRVPGARATATACSRPTSQRRSARSATTCPATRACRRSARRRTRRWRGCRAPRCNTVERCSGHDGTWGVKRSSTTTSMKIGTPGVPRRWPSSRPTTSAPIARSPGTTSRKASSTPAARARAQGASAHAAAHGLRPRLITTQPTMPTISRESLMTLEAYAKARKDFRASVIAHKKPRTVHLGEHVTLLFEDELTIRYQVQEMLRIEKIFEEAGIQDELDAYNPLIPDGAQLQGDDADRVRGRRRARATRSRSCKGIEDRVWVRVEGCAAGLRDRRRGPRPRERARRPPRCTSCASSSRRR